MPYRLPLRVNKTLSGVELIDAAGRVIATAVTEPWHGAPIERCPDFVLENFQMLAAAANAIS